MGLNRIGQDLRSSYINAYNIDAAKKDVAAENVKPVEKTESVEKVSYNKAPKHSNPADFTFDFKKGNSYNLVSATNSMEDVDLEKAKKDMKKDLVLDQYKYFVGEPNLGTDADGTVKIVKR